MRAGGSGMSELDAAARDRSGGLLLLGKVDARHDVVDVLDHPEELGVPVLARVRERVDDLAPNGAGVGAEDDDAIPEEDGLLDEMRDEEDRREARQALREEPVDLGAQGLRRQHVERRERLVHAEQLGAAHEGARDPDALLHSARELLRKRARVARESHGRQDGLHALVRVAGVGGAARDPDADVLLDGEPRESAKFWKTTAAPGWMPTSGLPCCSTTPEVGGMSPIRMRRSVDFPQPDGPRTATTSFGRTSKSTPSRMTRASALVLEDLVDASGRGDRGRGGGHRARAHRLRA